MSTDAIAPCPFCGRPAAVTTKSYEQYDRFTLGCPDGDCLGHAARCDDPAYYGEAVRLWNTRSSVPPDDTTPT